MIGIASIIPSCTDRRYGTLHVIQLIDTTIVLL